MCSIGEDDFGDEGGLHAMPADPSEAPPAPTASIACRGCNEPGAVTVVKLPCKEPQCVACFLAYVRHKFRANLGANKLVPRNGRVLVNYDGSANASALLDMIRFACTMDRFKKLHIEPCVLFVDEHCLLPADGVVAATVQRTTHLHRIRRLLQQFGIAAYYVSVAQTAANCVPVDIHSAAAEEAATDAALVSRETEFAATVRQFETLTAQQEFVAAVRTNVMRECAERLDCRFAFVADTCPDLAVRLLANIALGRGTSVGDDVAFCDARGNGAVRILRPLRDFSALEVEQYVRLAAVEWWCGVGDEDGRTHDDDAFGSIQNLTRAFVDDLQTNFQSTVSTVFRTGSKIAAVSTAAVGKGKASSTLNQQQEQISQAVPRCKICGSALDCESSETLMAIEFSRQCALKETRSAEGSGSAGADVWSTGMCYGCRNVFRDVKDENDIEKAVNWLK